MYRSKYRGFHHRKLRVFSVKLFLSMKTPKRIVIAVLISSLLSALPGVAQVNTNPYPLFPGGPDSLASFLRKNLHWPEREIDIQGRVIVQFTVTKTGKIKHPYITRKLYKSVDAEALRVIKLMPNWIPAHFNGKPVEMMYAMPINFTMTE